MSRRSGWQRRSWPPCRAAVRHRSPCPLAHPALVVAVHRRTASALSPVLAATIDNLAPARPQTGLTDANVGYVLPVEGGLSRILAPVRLALSVTRPGLAGTCGAALCECVVRLGGSGVLTAYTPGWSAPPRLTATRRIPCDVCRVPESWAGNSAANRETGRADQEEPSPGETGPGSAEQAVPRTAPPARTLSAYLSVTQEDIQPPQTSPRERASMPDCRRSCLYDRARQGLRSRATGPRSRVGREWLGHLACLPSQDRSRGGQGEKGHAMTDNDDLPAEVRRQDEEAELQIAAQLAGLGKGTEATHDDDLPAEVRRQDEEAELQIAAQVAGLRTDEDVVAARRRWSDLSKRTRILLVTAAGADGALRVAALIDIQRRPASQIRGRKWMWAAVVALASSAGVVPMSYFVFGRRRQPRSRPG